VKKVIIILIELLIIITLCTKLFEMKTTINSQRIKIIELETDIHQILNYLDTDETI
jgi:uncharacterized protein YxeA